MKTTSHPKVHGRKGIPTRWPEQHVLQAARTRAKALSSTTAALAFQAAAQSSVQMSDMLRDLMTESGWSEDEFLDALCRDIIAHANARARKTGSR
jgi:hypothetical protein